MGNINKLYTMETTKEKILGAAKESPEAKKALEKLFPKAFERSNNPLMIYHNSLNKEIDTLDYDIYSLIPGEYSQDKAEWILNTAFENLPK